MSRFNHSPHELPLITKDTLAEVRRNNRSLALDELMDELPALRHCLQSALYSLERADTAPTATVAGEEYDPAGFYLESAEQRLNQGWNWVARLINREFEYFPGSVIFEDPKLQNPTAWSQIKRKIQKSKSAHPLITAVRDHCESPSGEDLTGAYQRLHQCITRILAYCVE